MKKFLICILTLILLTSTLLVSCNNTPVAPPSSNGEQPDENQEQATVTEQSIKADVMKFFGNDSEYQNYYRIFDPFLGDYSLNVNSGAGIDRVWQKDGVTVMEYNDGHSVYSLTRNGYAFSISETQGALEVISAEPLTAQTAPIHSIFNDFGIDISTMYTDKEYTVADPVLTEDMISVSEDLTSATLSSGFMASFVNVFLDGLSYNDTEKEEFLSDYTASGNYSVIEGKLTIVVNGNFKETGKTVLTIVNEAGSNGNYITETMEYVTKTGDADIPTTVQLTVSDIAYNDAKEIVRAKFVNKITLENVPTVIDGENYLVSTTVTKDISLDVEKQSIDARVTQLAKAEVNGQLSTGISTATLKVENGNFTYISLLNGANNGQMQGQNVTFDTPEGAEIPQAVYQKADEKYNSLGG